MKYRQQYDSSDCGAACFAMIASHYGLHLNIAKVRDLAGTDSEGTNFKGLIDVAKRFNLKSRVVKGEQSAINEKLFTPFVAHLKTDSNLEDGNHFVVVKKISKNHIYIWNPDPLYKKQKVSYEQFFDNWTGYAIFLEPDVGFTKSDKKQNLLFKFIPVFLPHKKLLVFSFLCSVLLLAFGIITSFYYKYLFDEVIYAKAEFSLHTLSVGVLLAVIIQSVVGCVRSILLSHFSYKTDLQLNFSYLSHIFN